MLRTVISDFARTLLFPKNPVSFLELNEIHKREVAKARNKNVYALNNEDFILSEKLYPAEDFFEVNYPLLELYRKLKAKSISLILFTNSFIPSHPDLKDDLSLFDQQVNVHDLGPNMSKKETTSFKVLCEKFNIINSESVFIDDDPQCLKAAQEQNIQTIQFPHIKAFSQDQLFEELNKAVSNIEIQVMKLLQ